MKRQHSLRHTVLHRENSVLHLIDSAPERLCTTWTQNHTGLHHVDQHPFKKSPLYFFGMVFSQRSASQG
jgi:hypothetical protein